jgi:hypothetical protein
MKETYCEIHGMEKIKLAWGGRDFPEDDRWACIKCWAEKCGEDYLLPIYDDFGEEAYMPISDLLGILEPKVH